MSCKIELISPGGLHRNPAYSQLVVLQGRYKTVYIGGQNAVDAHGRVRGKNDITEQARQVLTNLELALQAAGASFAHVIKWNVYIVHGQAIDKAFKVFQEPLSQLEKPPLVTGVFVAGLAHPDYLLEVEALAIIPEP